MSTRPMIGCRVSLEWKAKIEDIATSSGRNVAQVVYEAVEVYLNAVNNNSSVRQTQELQKRLETLENNTSLSLLSDSHQDLAQRVAVLERMVISLNAQTTGTGTAAKVMLSSEALAGILGVTPRAVNHSAEEGKEHFQTWVKRFKKGNWDFESLNPWAKKQHRKFFSVP